MRVRGLLKKALSFAGHDVIVRLESAVKKALDETQLLFDSLMQEYFD